MKLFIIIAILISSVNFASAVEDAKIQQNIERLQPILGLYDEERKSHLLEFFDSKNLKIEKRLKAYYITCLTEDGLRGLPAAGLGDEGNPLCEALRVCSKNESPFRSTKIGATTWDSGPHCRTALEN